MNIKIKSRVKIHCIEISPYNGKIGTVVGTKKNVMKDGQTDLIYMIRLDKPHRPGFEVIGLPPEALEII